MLKINSKIAFKDRRGKIIDLIEDEKINSVTLITIRKGATRGNHYHKNTWQWNYIVSGKMKLVTKMPNKKIKKTLLNPGDLALTMPGEFHALIGVKYCKCLVFAKGPRSGRAYESDTFRLKKPLVELLGK
jgi:quercetin dioxygenase-like cupin family protein|tara:strand:+ start:567 stop:956 length:390 start_codon:yes stop_codon:yes gene_type:complete